MRDEHQHMLRRTGLATMALLAVTAYPAGAGPRPSCNLIVDGAGDAKQDLFATRAGSNIDSVDVVSADVANSAKQVTTVVRVAHLGNANDAAPFREEYQFFLTLGSHQVVTVAARSVDGETFAVIYNKPEASDAPATSTVYPATGIFDVVHNEVRITFPSTYATGGTAVPTRATFTELAAQTARGVGSNLARGSSAYSVVDGASTTQTYDASSPSCVRVGR